MDGEATLACDPLLTAALVPGIKRGPPGRLWFDTSTRVSYRALLFRPTYHPRGRFQLCLRLRLFFAFGYNEEQMPR